MLLFPGAGSDFVILCAYVRIALISNRGSLADC